MSPAAWASERRSIRGNNCTRFGRVVRHMARRFLLWACSGRQREEGEMTKLGVVFTADRQPEELAAFATAAESAGLDELWLWEDCFLMGGIATSATALAATTRITVGLGVMPAVFRNAVAAAMEIATVSRLHPGRFIAGLGHGVPAWMDQIGALPPKPVRALEETTVAIRRLLAGERFSAKGDYVDLRDVYLERPPSPRPPLLLGVRRPLGLRASGRV